MRCVEIIPLRSLEKAKIESMDELLRQVFKSKTAEHPAEIRMYHHSIVETNLSIHIYGETKQQHQRESLLGQQFSYALKGLGLLNHSLWVEAADLEGNMASKSWKF